jgi:hypothetical protein
MKKAAPKTGAAPERRSFRPFGVESPGKKPQRWTKHPREFSESYQERS